jgi:hypothetical protein
MRTDSSLAILFAAALLAAPLASLAGASPEAESFCVTDVRPDGGPLHITLLDPVAACAGTSPVVQVAVGGLANCALLASGKPSL